MTERVLRRTGGVFAALARERLGAPLDLGDLDLARHPPERVALARDVWAQRLRTEFRSAQIMTRFLGEVLGAGDPLEVYAAAIDLVEDEVRHVSLTAQLCEALGVEPRLPDPVRLDEPERYRKAPMAERALTTAVQMLAINETLSVAFIEDLRVRCDDPAVRRVLDATVADEEGHEALGWEYVERSLARFPVGSLDDWRHLVRSTIAPHEERAQRILADVPAAERALERYPERELAALGLFGPRRQALVYRRCLDEVLTPRLRALSLWS